MGALAATSSHLFVGGHAVLGVFDRRSRALRFTPMPPPTIVGIEVVPELGVFAYGYGPSVYRWAGGSRWTRELRVPASTVRSRVVELRSIDQELYARLSGEFSERDPPLWRREATGQWSPVGENQRPSAFVMRPRPSRCPERASPRPVPPTFARTHAYAWCRDDIRVRWGTRWTTIPQPFSMPAGRAPLLWVFSDPNVVFAARHDGRDLAVFHAGRWRSLAWPEAVEHELARRVRFSMARGPEGIVFAVSPGRILRLRAACLDASDR